jgi:alkanesulfonate monooxygenase SsuD/methylene tetrahydromethanopterin reductase-like flavin-dependent oxidoreductase (luciferase family)
MEHFLFLPAIRQPFEHLVATARAAEAAGFTGMVGMDHLVPPAAESQPMFEAMTISAWLAAHTERLKVGSLVLCDAMRHPAVLAKQAVSLDHASGGRFELGIGWGSYQPDFDAFGLTPRTPRERVARLRESLEVIRALWSGERVDYEGEFYRLEGALQSPRPLDQIPIVIGGGGPKTLALVREHADWWNLDIRHRDKYTGDAFDALRAQVGDARVSLQVMVGYLPSEAQRGALTETARRRFGYAQPQIGTGDELRDFFGGLAGQGVERVYLWFCDFAPPETLAGFGEEVIRPLGQGGHTTTQR